MRLIPGKTKVQIELFKGVTLTDVVLGLIAAVIFVFVLVSDLPGKLYWSIAVILLAVLLLVRIDEPNYAFLMRIFRHIGYKHHFRRTTSDAKLIRQNETEVGPAEEREMNALELQYREENPEEFAVEEVLEEPEETAAERKARLKAEAAERKADDKILKNKETTKEEADAIWLKRAQQSAAKKQSRAKKKQADAHPMKEIIGFTKIADGFIEYAGEYFGAVLEIPPVEFRFFSEHRRNNAIENAFGRVLRAIPMDYSMNIVKLERPVRYEDQLDGEYDRMNALTAAYESGELTEEEYRSRVEILMSRYSDVWDINYNDKVIEPYYYIVLYNSDRSQLNMSMEQALSALQNGEMKARRLNDRELALFLKYSNGLDFDPAEVDKLDPKDYAEWAMPHDVSFQHRTATIDGLLTHNLRVLNYPAEVGDAWLASVMTVPATKVVVKCKPMERDKATHRIDRSLQELRGQFMATGVDSRRLELEAHIDTLSQLLATLQGENEVLLDVNIYITAYDVILTHNTKNTELQTDQSAVRNLKKTVRRCYSEQGIRLSGMDFDQVNGFIGSQINAWDPFEKSGRGIPSNTVAAAFPWIFASICDKGGIKLGDADGTPVFVDFFQRDNERVNSNMVIVGKSGSGKSYATKSLLANLAVDDSKIFILDPENEYTELAHNLHGKFINVGNATQGRINPFQIITALDDDEETAGNSGSYATHMQFLEEFFRQILPDCDKDSLEYLNSLIDRMYMNKGISGETNLSALKPEDYPIFDDLYDAILSEFQATDNEYIHSMLRMLINYVAKFSTGGRNANIWNGPSTITTDENFTVFNFQSLLANRNGSVANAQMLLVLKYIDNEIIKNRDFNLRHHTKRKIVVVIDEAHVFIDAKYPAALDFMYQLAKRIRKYNGMQIVITQNIKDFVGSEELARKSTAIINACQYSFIFALAPNDMDDLCKLYAKAGGINENEQEEIVSAPRGQAFVVMSPQSRSSFSISTPENVVDMFQNQDYEYRHFGGEYGEAAWESIVGKSRAKHEAAVAGMARKRVDEQTETAPALTQKRSSVTFMEVDAEAYRAEQAAAEQREAEKKRIAEENKPAEKQEKAPTLTEESSAVLFEEISVPEAGSSVRFEEIPERPQQTLPAPVQLPPAQQSYAAAPVDQLLMERLSKFSYDAMLEEIRRSVKSELEAQAGPEYLKASQLAAEASAAEELPAAAGAAIGSIFNEAAMQQLAEETSAENPQEEPEAAADDDFDLMKMLMEEASDEEEFNCFELMKEYGEMTLSITLEDLMRYNAAH